LKKLTGLFAAVALLTGCATKPAASASQTWDAFWQSVNVSPSPPRDFLDGDFVGQIMNYTDGKLDDQTVRAWALADMRRGRGDSWSYVNLRRDMADANIFGPPGLNGTGAGIEEERKNGVAQIDLEIDQEFLAAGVIWVAPEVREKFPDLGLTEYIIVIAYLPPQGRRARVFADGRREPLAVPDEADEVHWQLDTGHFVDHPVLGPLWYQQMGYSCIPNDRTVTGKYCGLVEPQ
jgi:hypothetical protein